MRTQPSDQFPVFSVTELDDYVESRRAKVERLKEAFSRGLMRVDTGHIASRILERGDLVFG